MTHTNFLDDVTHPELIFGLVGPIGVNMDDVQASLAEALKQVGYQSKLIHLTEVISSEREMIGPNPGTVYGQKIETANLFCQTAQNGAALAGVAVTEIRKFRENHRKGEATGDVKFPAIPKQAYIIR